MSLFSYAKDRAELEKHCRLQLAYINSLDSFYKEFPLEFHDANYEENWIEFSHKASKFDTNRFGTIHGGVIVMMMDTVIGTTAYETGTGNSCPTMDINIRYLKAVKVGDEMIIRATVVSSAKHNTVINSEVRVNGEVRVMASSNSRMYKNTVANNPVFGG